jgi:excinuclease ABC subunit B
MIRERDAAGLKFKQWLEKGYIHTAAADWGRELVPFVLPGGKRLTPNSDKSRAGVQRRTSNSETHVSRTDEPPEKFDAHTPGVPLIVEQIIRPTGLLDPKITLKPLKNQIDETIELCRQRVEKAERVLVTTLTKRSKICRFIW